MTSYKGCFLVASSLLDDPNFHRTVLLMLEHTAEGAAGVVLNRPTDSSLATIAEPVLGEPTDWEKPIHLGGPVPGPLLVLHGGPDGGDREVLPGVYSTVDPDRIRELVVGRVEPSLLIANYAGWGPGQLESELAEQAWYTAPATAEEVFGIEAIGGWSTVVRSVRIARMSRTLGIVVPPRDPTLN